MEKPPVIKDNRTIRKRKITVYSLLIAVIVAGISVYQGLVLKKTITNEELIRDKERDFYRETREKNLVRLSALSQEFESLSKEKIDIEKRLNALLTDKAALEKEKKELLENLREAEAQTKEIVTDKEEKLRASLSRGYEKEIAGLKQKINELEKFKEEPQNKKEIEELERKNKELLGSIIKAKQSNEYFMKKIEDLQKIRNELEEELRRKNLSSE